MSPAAMRRSAPNIMAPTRDDLISFAVAVVKTLHELLQGPHSNRPAVSHPNAPNGVISDECVEADPGGDRRVT